MKSIMYHYVRTANNNLPKLKFLNFHNFKKQLDFFEENYGFLSFDEWQKYFTDGHQENRTKKVLLTFDDGMSCHYDFVFHELKKRKLWGFFFIATDPYTKREMLNVHKLHSLLSVFNGKDVYIALQNVLKEDMTYSKEMNKFDKYTYINQLNEPDVVKSKRLFNYFVRESFKKDVINEVAKILNYRFDIDNYYVSERNLKVMAKSSMIIGSQTESHPVMANLDYDCQEIEIKNSFEYISHTFAMPIKTYCHPFGNEISYNQNTIDLLSKYKVDYSFAVNPIDIEPGDFKKNKRQILPRYDCNEFIFGKAD